MHVAPGHAQQMPLAAGLVTPASAARQEQRVPTCNDSECGTHMGHGTLRRGLAQLAPPPQQRMRRAI